MAYIKFLFIYNNNLNEQQKSALHILLLGQFESKHALQNYFNQLTFPHFGTLTRKQNLFLLGFNVKTQNKII